MRVAWIRRIEIVRARTHCGARIPACRVATPDDIGRGLGIALSLMSPLVLLEQGAVIGWGWGKNRSG